MNGYDVIPSLYPLLCPARFLSNFIIAVPILPAASTRDISSALFLYYSNRAMAPAANKCILQPKTTKYEWGGPIGGFFMVLFLPALVIALNTMCSGSGCRLDRAWQLPQLMRATIVEAIPQLPKAMLLEVVWLALHAAFYLLPLGPLREGLPLRNGKVLSYRMNAIHAFVLCHVGALGGHVVGVINLSHLADMFNALMLGSVLLTFAMSVVLYAASYRHANVLTTLAGNSGNVFNDFWIGRELNPRTGFLDWKFMCELRPGLIGWSLLNWAFVAKSVATGTFAPNIAFIAFFESFYVLEGLLFEAGNLTMMDVVTDGFGFMLCFGDLTWVPFTYTLKTKYLAYNPVSLSPMYIGLSAVVVVLGYVIFRGANTEKDRFRTNPKDSRVQHLHVMKTSKGKSLLISGYWGVCRHPNYVGDWLMSLGWAAFCGTNALLPLFHPLYFGILLIHRQLRDEEHMLHKYGEKDWRRFCSVVRYRLIPYIY